MHLPKNIKQSDRSLARSFSEELGLDLSFRTRKELLWQGHDCIGRHGMALMQEGDTLVTLDGRRLGLWDMERRRLIQVMEVGFECTTFFNSYSLKKLDETRLLVIDNLEVILLDLLSGKYRVLCSAYGSQRMAFDPENNLLYLKTSDYIFGVCDLADDGLISEFSMVEEHLSGARSLYLPGEKQLLFICHDYLKEENRTEISACLYELHEKRLELLSRVILEDCYEEMGVVSRELIYRDHHDYYAYDLDSGQTRIVYPRKGTHLVGSKAYLDEGLICSLNVQSIRSPFMNKIERIPLSSPSQLRERMIMSKVIGFHCSSRFTFVTTEEEGKGSIIRVFDDSLDEVAHFSCAPEKLNLLGIDIDKRSFHFKRGILSLETGAWKPEFPNFRELEVRNMFDSDFFVGKTVYEYRDYLEFHKRSTGESHTLPLVDESAYGIHNVEYLKEKKRWLLFTGRVVMLYDAYRQRILKKITLEKKKTSGVDTRNISCHVTADLEIVITEYRDLLEVFDFKNGVSMARRTLVHDRCTYFLRRSSRILLLELPSPKNNKGLSQMELTFMDLQLRTIREQAITLETGFSMFSVRAVALSHNEKMLVYVLDNVGAFLIDLESGKDRRLGDFRSHGNYPEQVFSSDDRYVGIKSIEEGLRIFRTGSGELLGTVEDGMNMFSGGVWIDEQKNRLFLDSKSGVKIYSLEPFAFIGDMLVNPDGTFSIILAPDEGSTNGWFYSDVPHKINVLKIRSDGTDPEVLALEDQERQEFVKYNHRKDIVLKRIFEADQYEAFLRLNRAAAKMAWHDLALERKIEVRKLGSDGKEQFDGKEQPD